jgi:hypothetical protein
MNPFASTGMSEPARCVNINGYALPLLTSTGCYAVWAKQWRAFLKTQGLWGIADPNGPLTAPSLTDSSSSKSKQSEAGSTPIAPADSTRLYNLNSKAEGHLFLAMGDEELQDLVDRSASARATWKQLEQYCQGNEQLRLQQLHHQLASLRYTPDDTMATYCGRAQRSAKELKISGLEANDLSLVTFLLVGLPAQFDSARAVANSLVTGKDWKLQTVIDYLV